MYTFIVTHAHSCINSFSHTHMHTLTHTFTHTFLLHKPNPRLSSSLSLQNRPGLASSDGCSLLSFPFWFYLFCFATMSIFGEGSIFTLSGNIFPLSHELGTSVRRLLAAVT